MRTLVPTNHTVHSFPSRVSSHPAARMCDLASFTGRGMHKTPATEVTTYANGL